MHRVALVLCSFQTSLKIHSNLNSAVHLCPSLPPLPPPRVRLRSHKVGAALWVKSLFPIPKGFSLQLVSEEKTVSLVLNGAGAGGIQEARVPLCLVCALPDQSVMRNKNHSRCRKSSGVEEDLANTPVRPEQTGGMASPHPPHLAARGLSKTAFHQALLPAPRISPLCLA